MNTLQTTSNQWTTAKRIGAKILHAKVSGLVSEGFSIVMARTERGEYVTWLFANGAFHHGHYFGNDFKACVMDWSDRN